MPQSSDRPGWKAGLKAGTSQTEPGEGKTDGGRPPQAVPEFKRKAGIRRAPNTRVCGSLGWGSYHLNGDITCGDLPKLIHIILIDSPHTGLKGSLGNLQGSQCDDDGIERG